MQSDEAEIICFGGGPDFHLLGGITGRVSGAAAGAGMQGSTHGLFFCLPGVQLQLHSTEELIRCWQSPGAGEEEENLVAAPRCPQLQGGGTAPSHGQWVCNSPLSCARRSCRSKERNDKKAVVTSTLDGFH